MANYLINSPSSETVGTDAGDLFDLRQIQGTTIFGNDGADTVSATTLAGSAAKLNAGAGADAITVTAAGTLFQGSVFAGSGDDVITADAAFSAAIIRGGSGNDTIDLMAGAGSTLDKTTVNGNDNNDLLTAVIVGGSDSSFIAAGKGKDTVDLTFSGANAFTINGGAGHDQITLSAGGADSLSAFVINGGKGKDSIEFEAGAANISGNTLVDGGDQADRIRFAAATTTVAGSATIAGGEGADSILFSASLSLNEGYVLGGAGHDSIRISAGFDAGTVNGGSGNDILELGTYDSGGQAGNLQGGDGADTINLGAFGATVSGGTYTDAGATVRYGAFTESNLSAIDYVSAGFTVAPGTTNKNIELFTLSQDVLTATVAGGGMGNAATFTATLGVATFTSTFDSTLTARAVELDRMLTKGQTVYFTNGAGNDKYVFIQGGASSGGNGDDLVVQVSTAVETFTVGANSAISVQANLQ